MTLAIAEGVLVRAALLTGCQPTLIRKRTRKHHIVRIRQAMMYVIRKRTNWSYPMIARFLGLKDHSTIIHGEDVALKYAAVNSDFAKLLEELMEAEEVVPFSTEEMLKGVSLRTGENERLSPDVEPIVVVNVVIKPMVYAEEKEMPKAESKTTLKFEKVYDQNRTYTLDEEDGDTPENIKAKDAIRQGSADLGKAILSFLAERAAQASQMGAMA